MRQVVAFMGLLVIGALAIWQMRSPAEPDSARDFATPVIIAAIVALAIG